MPEHGDAKVAALPLYRIQYRKNLLVRERVLPAELRMEIEGVVWNLPELIIDLVGEALIFLIEVLHGNPAGTAERHLKVAVESRFGIAADKERIDLPVFQIG